MLPCRCRLRTCMASGRHSLPAVYGLLYDVFPQPRVPAVPQIGAGLVVFVCFQSGCDEAAARRAAAAAVSARLSESPSECRRVAVSALPGDLLVVPQASLGGQLRGRQFQYHGNVSKADGARLYRAFVEAVCEAARAGAGWQEAGRRVRCGRYGARQVLSAVTNGPYSHLIEM